MKQIALILTLLLAAAGASAQEVFIGADFDTRFDNREHSDCNIDDSHTFFSMRLTPKAGVIWSEKNQLVVAVDLLQDFGDKEHKFLSKVDPQIYYQFNSKTAQAVAGIFPRSLLLARYDPFFLGSATRSIIIASRAWPPTINPKRSFIEFALDWEGMRSYQTREKFRILSGGEYKGRHWYGGYVMTLLHYAKTDNTELDEGVVDHILLNPYVATATKEPTPSMPGWATCKACSATAAPKRLESAQRRAPRPVGKPLGCLSAQRTLRRREHAPLLGHLWHRTLCQRPLLRNPQEDLQPDGRHLQPPLLQQHGGRFGRILFPLRRRGPGPAADPESIGQSAKNRLPSQKIEQRRKKVVIL